MTNEEIILIKVIDALRTIPDIFGICVDDGGFASALVNSNDTWQIMEVCFSVEDCTLYVVHPDRRTSHVRFIWGNGNDGLDCICDHTTDLNEILAPVTEWIESRA